ncbi:MULTISPECIES: autotransporter outer membrane beta-barrel domain-containing protein [unclassified Candidatus Tisiphia]|uniref:autotransporter outer membrane beta-barrel domain-containing protein n=1 Tax=unclassified Candidatus Tisiphia TaxID=2996318 RepID=UPI00312C7F4C
MMLFHIVKNRYLNRYLVEICIVFVSLFLLLQEFYTSNVLAAGLNEETGQSTNLYLNYSYNEEVEAIWSAIDNANGKLKKLKQERLQIINPFKDINELKEHINSLTADCSVLLHLKRNSDFKKQNIMDEILSREETKQNISVEFINNYSLLPNEEEYIYNPVPNPLLVKPINTTGLEYAIELPSNFDLEERKQAIVKQSSSSVTPSPYVRLERVNTESENLIESISMIESYELQLQEKEDMYYQKSNAIQQKETEIYELEKKRKALIESEHQLANMPSTHHITQPVTKEEVDTCVDPYQALGNNFGLERLFTENTIPIVDRYQSESYTQTKVNDRKLMDSEDELLSLRGANKETPVTINLLSLQDELELSDPNYRKKRSIGKHDNADVASDEIVEESFGLERLFEETTVPIIVESQDLIVETGTVTEIPPITEIALETALVTEAASITEIASATEILPITEIVSETALVTETASITEIATATEIPPITEIAPLYDPPSLIAGPVERLSTGPTTTASTSSLINLNNTDNTSNNLSAISSPTELKLNSENPLDDSNFPQSNLLDQILDEKKNYITPNNFNIENNIVRHTTLIAFDYLNLISNALSIRNNILQHNSTVNVVEAGDNDYYIGKRGWIQFVRSISKQRGSILAFKNNQQGFILGFDVQPLDKLIIGIAYATASSYTKFQSIFNDQQNTILHVAAIYSKYTLLPNIHLNSYIKYGKAFIQNLGRREGAAVHSKTKGDITRAKLETYYELKLDKLLFKPIVGIVFDHFLIGNFTEYRKEFNINIPAKRGKRILLETGIGLSKSILVKNISIIPEIHLKLDSTLLLKNSTGIISFTNIAHQTQAIPPSTQPTGLSPKNFMYTLGGYVNMQSVLALELAAGYDYSFKKNFTTHSFYVNGLVKF